MRQQPPTLRRQFETLEARRMLALTIITPDEALAFPRWAYDMGAAIVAREGVFDRRDANGDGIIDIVQNARVDLFGPVDPVGAGVAARDLVLYDWTMGSDTPGTANEMAGALVDWIVDRLENVPMQEMHFIGHGRGALVNMEALRQLAAHPLAGRIGHVQMTTLDPYARGADGAIEFNPGGLVDFADNYYQDGGQLERGQPILGALNFHLNEQLAAWQGRTGELGNHHEVHDWYFWTIAVGASFEDGPRLADPELPRVDDQDRVLLYDSYEADLDDNDSPDDFAGGNAIGYYFTVAGGGIGTYTGDYTFDVARRTMPLYLGSYLAHQPWDTLQGIAYAPNGDLYAMINAAAQTGAPDGLYRIQFRFDAQNHPVPERTFALPVAWQDDFLPFAFRSDGRIIAAMRGSDWETMTRWDLTEIDPDTGAASILYRMQSVNQAYTLAMATDHANNAYLSTVAGFTSYDLVRVNSSFTNDSIIPEPPSQPTLGAMTMVGGVLYGFDFNERVYSVNLDTLKFENRGEIIPPFEGPNFSPGTITSVHSLRQPRWHNRDFGPDVDASGRVNSTDVLIMINTLLLEGSRSTASTELFAYHYDVTNDGRINTSDLLSVINYILSNTPSGPAELQEAVTAEPLVAAPLVETVANVSERSTFDLIAFAMALDGGDDEDEEGLW